MSLLKKLSPFVAGITGICLASCTTQTQYLREEIKSKRLQIEDIPCYVETEKQTYILENCIVTYPLLNTFAGILSKTIPIKRTGKNSWIAEGTFQRKNDESSFHVALMAVDSNNNFNVTPDEVAYMIETTARIYIQE